MASTLRVVPPGGLAGYANMTPASKAAWGMTRSPTGSGGGGKKRRKKKKATKKKASKRRKSSKKPKKGSAAMKRRMAKLRKMRKK
jgi:hypothetical protein